MKFGSKTTFRGGLNMRLNSDFRCMSVGTSGHSCQISKRCNTQRRTLITAAEQNPRCHEWSGMEGDAENNSLLSHAGINLSAPQLWQSDCLESEMIDRASNVGKARHRHMELLTPTSLPWQLVQIWWWCQDTQIRSDHMQVIVWTLSDSDVPAVWTSGRSHHWFMSAFYCTLLGLPPTEDFLGRPVVVI